MSTITSGGGEFAFKTTQDAFSLEDRVGFEDHDVPSFVACWSISHTSPPNRTCAASQKGWSDWETNGTSCLRFLSVPRSPRISSSDVGEDVHGATVCDPRYILC